jgi:hypothetical protein
MEDALGVKGNENREEDEGTVTFLEKGKTRIWG